MAIVYRLTMTEIDAEMQQPNRTYSVTIDAVYVGKVRSYYAPWWRWTRHGRRVQGMVKHWAAEDPDGFAVFSGCRSRKAAAQTLAEAAHQRGRLPQPGEAP